ncbi:MAG: glycosyltransferase family 2 protein [Chloroflexi bacterium]|nr:glycosyltransferase family 2 protein [Chloroflexota bacterium]
MADAPSLDLSVVVVSWNVRAELRECLASVYGGLAREPGLSHEVVVVDNASRDGSVEMVREAFPAAKVIASDHNLGFAGGCNQALALAHGRHVLVLNPDTRVIGDALPLLWSYLEAHPDVAVVGPLIEDGEGRPRPAMRRFPRPGTLFVESTGFQGLFEGSRLLQAYYCRDLSPSGTQEVDWLSGACLMVRRAAVEQVGGMDERFFLYCEELDWCRRMRAAGWKVVHLGEARVAHLGGRSSQQDLVARHVHFQDSKCKYAAKYHGRRLAAVLRAYLWLWYLAEAAQEGAKLLLGHRRGLRRQRLAILWPALRSGLRGARPRIQPLARGKGWQA